MALHTSTILSHRLGAILPYLSKISATYPTQPLLFTISSNASPTDLEAITLQANSNSYHPQSIGCISAPLPGAIDSVQDGQSLMACSVAVFDKAHAVPFRSTIQGREATQVGRWHAYRKKNKDRDMKDWMDSRGFEASMKEGVNWDEVWDQSSGISRLPEELRGLRSEDVSSVLYLSDMGPEGLSNSLSCFSNATKLGLIASSTPFVTGRPVTLFHNGKVWENGAVGIALTGSDSQVFVEFPGLKSITQKMRVTKSEGNLVNEIDNANPSKMLLSAIKTQGIREQGSFKDDYFYLGSYRNEKLVAMHHITAGDPSRGTIALESNAAPVEGTTVQFFHHPRSLVGDPSLSIGRDHKLRRTSPHSRACISFMAMSKDSVMSLQAGAVEGILPDTFLASSENGFLLSRSWGHGAANEVASTCTVPGGLGTLMWPKL